MAIIIFKSLSAPSIEYEVDTENITCTCGYFQEKSYKFSKDDPERLCKHLVRVLVAKGIPAQLKSNEEQIKWCAARSTRYMTKTVAATKIKEPVPLGSVETLSSKKKIKYLYLVGKCEDHLLHISVSLEDGTASFQINDKWCFCDAKKHRGEFHKSFQYMQDAIMLWIDNEYQTSMLNEDHK
ncbi:MAG: SWIM zinc finger family protein [Proteobacteria bacterium]|nr:SWIM zinc finger family protein [Pseudomonadota bacterium]